MLLKRRIVLSDHGRTSERTRLAGGASEGDEPFGESWVKHLWLSNCRHDETDHP